MNWLRLSGVVVTGAAMLWLVGCGNSSLLGSNSSNTNTDSSASSVSLSTSQPSVKSDGSESATVTARVLDQNKAAITGATVSFSATAGTLSASSATTDNTGAAQVTFSADSAHPDNATATVTASVSGVSTANIPLQIGGSTVTLTSPTSSTLVIDGTDTATIEVTAKNASGTGVYNVPVALSVTGTGAGTLGATSGTTDNFGKFSTTLQGTGAGTLTVTATALGDTDSASFTVQGASTAFQISSPTTETVTVETNGTQTITVLAPSPTTRVSFVSSHGTWAGNGQSMQTVAVAAGQASATLNASTAGTATVQVFDPDNTSNSDSLTVLIVSTTVDGTSNISLQATQTTIPVSTTTTKYTSTLTAGVRDANNIAIKGAPVVFTLSNTTGGGEYISPAYGTTDETGQVSTTFTSGTNASDPQGVNVSAELYDSAGSKVKTSSIDIGINQQAGSVVISTGSKISSINNDTAYSLPMAVLVADSQGNPVANQTVTLKAWPAQFHTGYWTGSSSCTWTRTGTFDNEDTDRDLNLDTGEDKAISEVTAGADLNGDADTTDVAAADGLLTPGNSAGGTLPSTVTTDENGVANFNLVYLKAYALWITDEITATTQVTGTETAGKLSLRLRYLLGEECNLSSSPFNPPL